VSPTDSDRFDHVLVDMNPLLHICLRKSRSDGHALTMLLKELDSILQQIRPTQSLVLAIDGPPSAAKLATQRKRRWQVLRSVSSKLQRLEVVGSKRLSSKQITQRKRRLMSETRTLGITPGTDFLRLAEQAILYWAWQRLDSRSVSSPLGQGSVKVFLSPSEVPGEGEVKLLEWIYKKPRRGESIAIVSGDSDLVLEALLVPIQSTHNVFVMWPGSSGKSKAGKGKSGNSSKQYICVGLYETTRRLQELVPNISVQNLMRLRTDLVLLLLLNGNDYLPKLRGSSGFNKLFGNYVRMQQEQFNGGWSKPLFLIDPDSLEFQLDNCINYFRRLAESARNHFPPEGRQKPTSVLRNQSSHSPLQRLRTFSDAGYIPKPIQFCAVYRSSREVINGAVAGTAEVSDEEVVEEADLSSDDVDEDGIEDDDEARGDDYESGDDEDEVTAADKVDEILVQLRLGVPGTDDSYMYEIWCPHNLPRKDAKQELARMALSDILDLEEEDDDYAEGARDGGGYYDWELREAAEAKIDSYLYGLVWNLQTYQDGICADYSWNYGKRRSPTANEVLNFFLEANSTRRQVGLIHLRRGPFSPPINAGVACLAALPCSEKHLVPEPYCWLADETVEEMYCACVDKQDNTFDASSFERMCNEYVSELPPVRHAASSDEPDSEGHGRRILMSDHMWTIVSKVGAPLTNPFDPPLPFSDRLSKLRPNNRIRISKIASIQQPRPRSAWGDEIETCREQHQFVRRDRNEVSHTDPAPFMLNLTSMEELSGKKAYPKSQASRKVTRPSKKSSQVPSAKNRPPIRLTGRSQTSPASESAMTTDGLSAMACLKQLEDGGLIGMIKWEESVMQEDRQKIRLLIMKGGEPISYTREEDLLFEQERDTHSMSKKAVKQHLAGLALREILGHSKEWSDHSFKDLRRVLQERSKQSTANSDRST
jgi:5'-3' exoribonuclease 2